jgi:NADPH:quinone reductase-like Zn-dependent oxidoreductase
MTDLTKETPHVDVEDGMKAVVQEKYGSTQFLSVQSVQRPTIGEKEVLVRVRAASLHPDVWHVVQGRPYVLRFMGSGLRRPKQAIPGTDISGIVEAVGKGVTIFRPGDAVFGETIKGHQWINGGAYAEYVAVPEDQLAKKPDNVSHEQAASVPTSGHIVLLNLRESDSLTGKSVLVNGAGGGVGSLALQIVKAFGAHVTAVDSTAKQDMLRTLGADTVIDYTRQDYTRRERRYDLIIDVPVNHSWHEIRRVMRPGGRYIPIGHEQWGASGKRVFGLIPRFIGMSLLAMARKKPTDPLAPVPTRNESMTILRDLLEAGKLTPVIDSTYPLSRVREAFRHMVEDETHGKVIIKMEVTE